MKTKRVPVLATTTTASLEDARKIAAQLVEERLAACVQIVEPVTRVYRHADHRGIIGLAELARGNIQ